MSITSRDHQLHWPQREPPDGLSPRNQQKTRAPGLTSATGLVIGSIIGTGVTWSGGQVTEVPAG
jgi:hypothetical protein